MQASLSRIILFGNDIDQLKTFYTENFGLTINEEIPHQWVVLNAGVVEIALHKLGEGYHTTDALFKAESNTKLVFNVKGDLNLLRQKLLNKGVMMREIKSFPGINSLFCDGEDPEGNVFQLEEKAQK